MRAERAGAIVASQSAGLALLGGLAAAALAAQGAGLLWVFSPIVAAILLGMALGNTLGVAPVFAPGVRGGTKALLRVAIVLLGFQLTLAEIAATGIAGLVAAVAAVAVTLPLFTWIGIHMGVRPPLAALVATGTAICGASAIVAANDIVRGRDDDVAYALAIVTLFGTVAIFLWPPIGLLLGLDQGGFGRWAGASIHEVGQVVAAGFQYGPVAGETATTVKLARVLLLAPALIGLSIAMRRAAAGAAAGTGRVPVIPPYIAGFLACVAINSAGIVPAAVVEATRLAVPVLFCMALGGIGLQTRFDALARHGIRPLLLGAIATISIAALTLAIIAAADRLGV